MYISIIPLYQHFTFESISLNKIVNNSSFISNFTIHNIKKNYEETQYFYT